MGNGIKRRIGIFAVALLCFAVTGCGKADNQTDTVQLEQLHVEVLVEDGVANPQNTIQKLEVSEKGPYTCYVNCKPDREGMLTGCVLYDEDGEVQFRVTGEEMESQSKGLDLDAGTYAIEFQYLTNEADYKKFVGKDTTELEPYAFEDSGTYNIDLGYGIEEGGSRSLYYYLGMIAGILFAIVLLVLIKWFAGKAGGRIEWKTHQDSYDERQLLVRGKAYKHAFFILIFYVAAVSLIKEFHGIEWFMSFCGMWIGVCFSITVFAVICIVEDAYMSLYENAKGVIILLSTIGAINIFVAVRIFVEGRSMLEDGVLSIDCMNVVVGIMFIIILAVFCGKLIYIKKHLDEEE